MLSSQDYDFIIVGGGTAGLVLANRLTEDPNVHVLVLEAGSNRLEDPRITCPGLTAALYDNPEFDWIFRSVPQEYLYDKVISYPRGKTLGGSSAINILGLVYPSQSSIDNWAKLGNKGWDWDTLAPYYRKFQTYIPPTNATKASLAVDYIDDSIQGRSGPIKSSFPDFVGPLVTAWPETFKNLGWNVTGDPMSGNSIGGFNGPYTVNADGRVRSHSGNEYYGLAANRPNLHLLTEAMVEKVVLEEVPSKKLPTSIHATGVSYSREGQRSTVRAHKDVILAAGFFQTPQLLELSGVGSSQLLSKFDINVHGDNPYVGENLQDHCMTGLCIEVRDDVPTADM